MVYDSTGSATIATIRENEIGIYDTTVYSGQVAYCVRNGDGSHTVRLKDGTEFTTKSTTVVIEGKR